MPDKTIFEETEFRFETLEQRFREMAFLNRGLTIEFCDERTDNGARWMSFYFEGGVRSFVRYLNKNRAVLHEPVYIEKEIEGNMVEAAIQYNDGYNESVFAFANTINTPDGGTHLTGLRSALTRTINDWAKQQGLLKESRRQLHRRGHARGPDRHHQRQAARSAVRVADQGQAAQQRDQDPGRVGRGRSADRVAGEEPAATARRSSRSAPPPAARATPRARRATW